MDTATLITSTIPLSMMVQYLSILFLQHLSQNLNPRERLVMVWKDQSKDRRYLRQFPQEYRQSTHKYSLAVLLVNTLRCVHLSRIT